MSIDLPVIPAAIDQESPCIQHFGANEAALVCRTEVISKVLDHRARRIVQQSQAISGRKDISRSDFNEDRHV
jgi:hypothetical protein